MFYVYHLLLFSDERGQPANPGQHGSALQRVHGEHRQTLLRCFRVNSWSIRSDSSSIICFLNTIILLIFYFPSIRPCSPSYRYLLVSYRPVFEFNTLLFYGRFDSSFLIIFKPYHDEVGLLVFHTGGYFKMSIVSMIFTKLNLLTLQWSVQCSWKVSGYLLHRSYVKWLPILLPIFRYNFSTEDVDLALRHAPSVEKISYAFCLVNW